VIFAALRLHLSALDYALVGSHTVKTKAAGIDIDLWAGVGMLLVAALKIAWALLSPVRPEPPEHRGRGSGRLRRSPAT